MRNIKVAVALTVLVMFVTGGCGAEDAPPETDPTQQLEAAPNSSTSTLPLSTTTSKPSSSPAPVPEFDPADWCSALTADVVESATGMSDLEVASRVGANLCAYSSPDGTSVVFGETGIACDVMLAPSFAELGSTVAPIAEGIGQDACTVYIPSSDTLVSGTINRAVWSKNGTLYQVSYITKASAEDRTDVAVDLATRLFSRLP